MSLADHFCADEVAQVFAYRADALSFLRTLPDAWVHTIITDPPYGLGDAKPDVVAAAITAWATGDRERVPDGRGFMGRRWDAFVPPPAVWDECLRVLKPGGHLAVFAGSRTADLMGLSIRLAGFDMRDGISAWLYGSGFPKSLDVGKAIDKAAGATREVVGAGKYANRGRRTDNAVYGTSTPSDGEVETAPATDAARAWSGWGTALKPAHEPILIARKPLAGTVAANTLAHGCGGLNVDACRVEHASAADLAESVGKNRHGDYGSQPGATNTYGTYTEANVRNYDGSAGRWPTNVVLAHAPELDPVTGEVVGDACADGCVPGCHVAALDEQSGTLAAGNRPAVRNTALGIMNDDGWQPQRQEQVGQRMDQGGASRFYPTFRYTAKAGKRERPQAWGAHPDCTCEPSRPLDPETGALPPWHRRGTVCATCERPATYRGHPTVKPQGLLEWLVALLTPTAEQLGEGATGTVLDPFAGSGSLGQAARTVGVGALLVERDVHSARLIAARLGVDEPRRDPAVPPLPVREVAPVVELAPAPTPTPTELLLAVARAADSLRELKDLARQAVRDELWTDDVRAVFTARRLEIEGVAA